MYATTCNNNIIKKKKNSTHIVYNNRINDKRSTEEGHFWSGKKWI